jgi:hypothetical protein
MLIKIVMIQLKWLSRHASTIKGNNQQPHFANAAFANIVASVM